MAHRQRDPVKEQFWRRHVAGWQRQGGSVRAYCRSQRLSEQSFYQWRRVLAQREAKAAAEPFPRGSEPGAASRGQGRAMGNPAPALAESPFLPVRVVPQASAMVLEVVLRGGRVLRVPEAFSAPALRQLVAVLEESPC